MEAAHSTNPKRWDPNESGQRVCLRDNPGRQGVTTGRTKTVGSFTLVEIDFGPNEKQYKNYELIELVQSRGDVIDLITTGRFGNQSDLRRVLTFEKIKGQLTNIFYSMESSNTDFYAHQFKPVMSFIGSPVGRLLIADEVGLGKTIEAIYIWKEIQARHGARRLLIVCPAMLREKWRSDLRKRFNISGEIVSAQQLLDRLTDISSHRSEESFVYIVGLESIRPPANFEDEAKMSTKARLARLLDQNTVTQAFALIDNVIIDEAHYLRNLSTGNNRIARLLRDAAKHLVLLTATPIQLGSDNLYQLLRLIDPDEFYDAQLFPQMLSANSHIVKAQRALWHQPPLLDDARKAIEQASQVDYFKDDKVLERLLPFVDASAVLTDEKRVEALRLLETRSLLSLYMTRSRKREVLEHRVQRTPQVLYVEFNPTELALYQHVTQRIRLKAEGKSGVSLFSLISRQRQMASSLMGALESWNEKGLTDELLWEDLGYSAGISTDGDDESGGPEEDAPEVAFGAAFDIRELEQSDTKYRHLKEFLTKELAQRPSEKFVVFAFFRGSLKYLHRRLRADGINATILMGDMGDTKDAVIADFARPDGPSVLLSSEVGSEGIDLQFCRFLVNYDLPWNPMRVEQRIGRLDRLGQLAERISIVNVAVANTIEDRILLRLYDRINVFRESIGDLEDILGEITESIIPDFLNRDLTDDEREKRSFDTALAIINRQKQQDELEQEAVNLVGFSDYILSGITESRDKGRWLSAGELITLVEDFFAKNFPGTSIKPSDDPTMFLISLSEEARRDLGNFIARTKPSTRSRLHQSQKPIPCIFDPRSVRRPPQDMEVIEPAHPLIQWVRDHYQNDVQQIYPLSAVKVSQAAVGLPAGDYVYCTQRWTFDGLKSENLLAFCASEIGSTSALTPEEAEQLVFQASRGAEAMPNAAQVIGDLKSVHDTACKCEQLLDARFSNRFIDFEAENSVRCQQQETGARKYAERRIDELTERVARFRVRGQEKLVPMTEGLIHKEREQLDEKLNRISRHRSVDPTVSLLATGFIRVE